MEGSRVAVSTLPVPTLRLQVPCWRPVLLSTWRGQGQHYQQRCSQTGSLGHQVHRYGSKGCCLLCRWDTEKVLAPGSPLGPDYLYGASW